MKSPGFRGIHENAFINRLKTKKYNGCVNNEIVTETWYRLGFEDAKRFLENTKCIKRKIEQGSKLRDPWIKLITHEYKNTITGERRRNWSTSLRPYAQGYGCDGTTDMNIHAIADILAKRQNIDYRSLLAQAYPNDFSTSDDFSWLEDDVVMAETIIPDNIDPDLALRDLEAINNYELAIKFGIELYRFGATSTNWKEIGKYLDAMKKQVKQSTDEWFENRF